MKVNSYSLSEVGKVRRANEDAYCHVDTINGQIFVVCDGMGGHVGGARASNLAAKSIVEFFEREVYENLILSIDRAFQFANEQIFAYSQADPSLQGMGTTAAILIIRGEDCYIGHVGDSRIYLKTDGILHRLTKDHSYVQGLVDSGVITDEEAESHPKRNQILKALGHSLDVQGTVCATPIKAKAGDVFLLCSDGLNGMIPDEYITQCIDFKDLGESGARLYEGAMNNRGADNITLILVGVTESGHTGKSSFISHNPGRNATTRNFKSPDDSSFSTKRSERRSMSPILIASSITLLVLLGIGAYLYLDRQKPIGSPQATGQSDEIVTEEDIKVKTFAQVKEYEGKGRKTNISNGQVIDLSDARKVRISVENGAIVKVEDASQKAATSVSQSATPQDKDEQPKTTEKKTSPTPSVNSGGNPYTLPTDMNIDEIKEAIIKAKKCSALASNQKLIDLNQAKVDKMDARQKARVNGSKVYPKGFIFSYECRQEQTEKPAKPVPTTVQNASQSKTLNLKKEMTIPQIRTEIQKQNKNCIIIMTDEELKVMNQEEFNKIDATKRNRFQAQNTYPIGFQFKYKCN